MKWLPWGGRLDDLTDKWENKKGISHLSKLSTLSFDGRCWGTNVTSCHCHVFVAPRKLRILSIATDGSRFFEQLNLIFCISLFSSDGALGRKTTGRRTSTQARTVCRRKRLFGSEIRLVCKTKFWIKWYNTKVSQYQINNHKLFKNLQAYDIKQADSSAPTQCSTEPVGCSVLGICPVSYYQTIFPFLCVHVTYIDQVPYAWNLSSMILLLHW